MKITFVYDCAYPFTKGGAEKRIYEFARLLSNSQEVKIACMKWWNGENTILENGIIYTGIDKKRKLYTSSGKRCILSGVIFGIKSFFFALKTTSDIYDIEAFPYFPLLLAKFSVVLKRKGIIIGYWSEWLTKENWKRYSRKAWFLGWFLQKLCLKCCDIVVANSNFTQKRIGEGSNVAVYVIPPVVIDEKNIEAEEKRKEFDIVYYGRIIEHKHVESIIEMVDIEKNRGENIKVLIIGEGNAKEKIRKMVVSKNLERHIRLIGAIEKHDDLMNEIRKAKIFVLPSEREGFGISVIEANACGLPAMVIDYPDNAAKDLIINGENGFVVGNIIELHAKIKWILEPERKLILKEMSKKSMLSGEKYSLQAVKEQIISVYFKQ